jgi:hypothetical protein
VCVYHAVVVPRQQSRYRPGGHHAVARQD